MVETKLTEKERANKSFSTSSDSSRELQRTQKDHKKIQWKRHWTLKPETAHCIRKLGSFQSFANHFCLQTLKSYKLKNGLHGVKNLPRKFAIKTTGKKSRIERIDFGN